MPAELHTHDLTGEAHSLLLEGSICGPVVIFSEASKVHSARDRMEAQYSGEVDPLGLVASDELLLLGCRAP